MKIKINTSVTLSTGESVTGSVIETFNESFMLSQQKFSFDLKVWRSVSDMDADKDHCYLYNSTKITNGWYAIPADDLTQAASDGHFGIIGTNHPARIKTAFASILGINASDVEIISLI